MPQFAPRAEMKPETSTAAIEAVAETMKSASEVQKEASARFSEINNHWLSRAKAETEEMTNLMQKLAGLKSPTEAMVAWQDWFSGRVKRATDDGRKLLEDSKSLMSSVIPKH